MKALELILDQQQKVHQEQQKWLIEQMAKLLHNQQVVQEENGNITVGGESSSRQIKDLADSMLQFDYEPEDNATFETWFSRYESMFTDEAQDLSDKAKIRLLLMKFPNTGYQRYADSILPKKPHEFSFDDTIKKLKLLFGHRETKFALRQKCFNIVKNDSEDFVQYAAKINKHAEKFDVTNCSSDDFKVQLFIAGLQSPNDSMILEKLLTKCDAQYVQLEALTEQAEISAFKKLNLQNLVNEAERMLCLKKDKSTIGESAHSKTEIYSVQQQSSSNSSKTPKCKRCPDTHYHKDCPFFSKQCASCKEIGHKAGFCDSFKSWLQSMKMRRERRKSDPNRNSSQSLKLRKKTFIGSSLSLVLTILLSSSSLIPLQTSQSSRRQIGPS